MRKITQVSNYIRQLWKFLVFEKRGKTQDKSTFKEKENPYIPWMREILEQVLKEKKIPYEQFAPVVIDGNKPEITLEVLELLSMDLNRLTILTNHLAYFEDYRDNMYEEQGLLVEIFPKTSSTINEMVFKENAGNVILDFEQAKEGSADMKFGEKVYIPIFKKAWESPGNLDIAVPIGYNTVIVRINKTEPKSFGLDKFERAFYDKE